MKTNEFKKILKPLIKEAVKEVILEEGMLSRVVSEVARGLNTTIVENKHATARNPAEEERDRREAEELYEKQRQERIKRLNESTGISSNIFKGTKEIVQETSHSPLSSQAPGDQGVDITAIEKLSSGKWKHLI